MAAFADTSFDVGAFSNAAFDLGTLVLVEVPDVVGETQAAGTADLEAVLFVVAVETAYSSSVAAGIIISQNPAAGVEAVEGYTVTITVSLGARADGAGSSKRRRRYYVEVDGQKFLVDSEPEARQILEHARALAERQAEQLAEKAVKVLTRKRKVPKVKIDPPVVSASPELDLAPLIADIQRLYAQAAMNAEIRLRMAQIAKQEEEEDEEEDLLLLL